MRLSWIPGSLLIALLSACAGQASDKPVEYLDDRTAMTVGSLKEPIELLPTAHQGGVRVLNSVRNRVSFAYLGPVEWDRSGTIVYGLWVHIAPGNDSPIADIRSSAALTLILDSGPRVLTPIDAPQLGRGPYQPVASWGQTAYFELTVEVLKQMAASQKLQLDVRGADNSVVNFAAGGEAHQALTGYLHSRGVTGD
ncbi:MAG: hypothetical protein JWN58_2472 [Gammaproteobacteria bacterium]|nr:hypothetical protein [Gammaproteobacteria bacterium]